MHAGDEMCGHFYVRKDDGRAGDARVWNLQQRAISSCTCVLAVIFVADPPFLSELVNEIEQRKSL